MSFVKRASFVAIIVILLVIIISMFLPSTKTVNKEIFFEADTRIVEQQLLNYSFIDEKHEFKINQENFSYTLSDKPIGVLANIKINFNIGLSPIKKFKMLFAENELELLLAEELTLLKSKIEDLPKIHKVKVEKTYRAEVLWFLSIRDTLNQINTTNIHGKLIEEVEQYIANNNLKTIDSPVVIYHYWSDSIIDIEAGIPISENIQPNSQRIKLNKIDTGFYVSATHFGAYERLPETYFGINEWMRKNKVTIIGPPFEFYISDPSSTANQEEWKTLISFPVK